MFGVQTASGVRKSLVRQIRCKAPTLLKWLQTRSLASFKLGRILDPENTVARTFFNTIGRKRNGGFEDRECGKLPFVRIGQTRLRFLQIGPACAEADLDTRQWVGDLRFARGQA
jgi:hypothetical protein